MIATQKPLHDLTAEDLMSRGVVVIPEEIPLRAAADLLLRTRTSGAPVVDRGGRCVGVLSAGDFLRLAATRMDAPAPTPIRSCSYQTDCRLGTGEVVTMCTLPAGTCPVQGHVKEPSQPAVCRDPHSVLTDWQMVEVEKLPADSVRTYMTPDPVTAHIDAPIRTLARMMIDTHVHRVIIVDDEGKPVGVVASSDILAAVAYGDKGERI